MSKTGSWNPHHTSVPEVELMTPDMAREKVDNLAYGTENKHVTYSDASVGNGTIQARAATNIYNAQTGRFERQSYDVKMSSVMPEGENYARSSIGNSTAYTKVTPVELKPLDEDTVRKINRSEKYPGHISNVKHPVHTVKARVTPEFDPTPPSYKETVSNIKNTLTQSGSKKSSTQTTMAQKATDAQKSSGKKKPSGKK